MATKAVKTVAAVPTKAQVLNAGKYTEEFAKKMRDIEAEAPYSGDPRKQITEIASAMADLIDAIKQD